MYHMPFPLWCGLGALTEKHLKNTFTNSISFSYVSYLFSLMGLFWDVSRAEDILVPMAPFEKVSGVVSAHTSHTHGCGFGSL